MKQTFVFFISLLLLLFSFLNALELTLDEKEYIKKYPTIKVQAEKDWPPFNYIEYDEIKGYSNDFIKLIGEKTELNIEFVQGHFWDDYLHMLEKNEIDIISNISITPKREVIYNFSEKPIFDTPDGIILKNDYKNFQDIKEFNDKTLAIVKGYYQENIIKEFYPQVNLLLTNNTKEAIDAVLNNKADGAIETMAVLNFYISKYFYTNLKVFPLSNNQYFTASKQYIAISKNKPILKNIIDKAIEEISDEEIMSLQKKWFNLAIYDKLSLSNEEKKYLSQKKELKYCIDPNFMPMEGLIDEKYVGISKDFLDIFQKSLNIPFILHKTDTWSESLSAAKNKECDFLSMAMKTDSREKYFDFTRPYYTVPLVLATKQDAIFIENLSKLNGKTIGIQKDFAIIELFKQKYPNIKIQEFSSTKQGLNALENGEIYAYCEFLPVTSYQIQRNFPNIKINTKIDDTVALSIGTRSDEPILKILFEKAIDTIDYKQRETILNHWIAVSYEKPFDFSIIWKTTGFFFICFIFILYWNRKLNLYNAKLKFLVQERNSLLKEVNHRVKNNFQLVVSMLSIEKNNFKDDVEKRKLSQVISRIKSMALVHQYLYDSKSLNEINANEYILNIVDEIKKIYENKNIEITLEIEQIILNMEEAISLGIIINEILNNSIKHHHEKNRCEIHISLKFLLNNLIELIIKDNGEGFDYNEKFVGLGLNLVKQFSSRLKFSSINYHNDNGTIFKLQFTHFLHSKI